MKYLSIIILLFLFSCSKDTAMLPAPVSEEEEMEKTPLTYLALGDSYTIGESVDYARNYPNQLYERLVAEEVEIAVPTIIAKTGWTTDELASAIKQENPASTYDLVSLAIGVNNQFRGYSQVEYEVEFEELLKQAIGFAMGDNSRVFVLSIPDYGFTPFGQRRNPAEITEAINTFNAINKKVTAAYEVAYFDITPISREGIDQPDLVASDGLHPSAKQYEEWVALFYEKVKEELLKIK